ncbi:hypothetical protein BO94DRAFT_358476 [Aspergillus sclerotioniger CBS 115572]|uniref:Uncharacterized protein n=1 Tax=Aspergillus sclerotioniger CBS 115572 TaxID=1450535 RepID=A0A317X7Z9_9EURO|nr:hypothetical protein BO94DRAFT_358476 [Aspergillus sclerotioniger CBS 115572]PWY93028.1 hypothetical protein BO94DRAFT_358476 [Aspergillus sclerotioniger CBS 115572]
MASEHGRGETRGQLPYSFVIKAPVLMFVVLSCVYYGNPSQFSRRSQADAPSVVRHHTARPLPLEPGTPDLARVEESNTLTPTLTAYSLDLYLDRSKSRLFGIKQTGGPAVCLPLEPLNLRAALGWRWTSAIRNNHNKASRVQCDVPFESLVHIFPTSVLVITA